jgi:hypothetical protein
MGDRLDELLSGGRLGGAERERILERALDASAPLPWWRRRAVTWLVRGTAMATAAALALFFFVPPRTHDDFRARGGAGDGAPLLLVGCEDGQSARCGYGQKLVFSVDGASEPGFVAAWAEPAGGGERVWYFPGDDGSSPEARGDGARQLLSRAVRLGPEQPPGRYRVHLVLSRRPLSRLEALAAGGADVVATSQVTLEVTP